MFCLKSVLVVALVSCVNGQQLCADFSLFSKTFQGINGYLELNSTSAKINLESLQRKVTRILVQPGLPGQSGECPFNLPASLSGTPEIKINNLSDARSVIKTVDISGIWPNVTALPQKSVVLYGSGNNAVACAKLITSVAGQTCRTELFTKFDSEGVTGIVSIVGYSSELQVQLNADILGLGAGQEVLFQIRSGTADDCSSLGAVEFSLPNTALTVPSNSAKEPHLLAPPGSVLFSNLTAAQLPGLAGKVLTLSIDNEVKVCGKIYSSWVWDNFYLYPTGPDAEAAFYTLSTSSNWLYGLLYLWIFSVLFLVLLWTAFKLFTSRDKLLNADSQISLGNLQPTAAAAAAATSSGEHAVDEAKEKGEEEEGGGEGEGGMLERHNSRTPLSSSNSSDTSLQVRGFDSHPLGTAALNGLHSLSVLWFLIYFLLVIDYYSGCQLKSIDSMCLYGSFSMFGKTGNSTAVFVIWWVFLVWFAALLVVDSSLQNKFRCEAPLDTCQYVQVRLLKPEQEVMTMYPNFVVSRMRQLKRKFAFLQASRFIEQNLPVQRSSFNGTRYFTFHCSRYTFQDSCFCKCSPDIGTTCKAIATGPAGRDGGGDNGGQEAGRGEVAGLSTATAAESTGLVGPNLIPFSVDSLPKAIKAEFARGFYLYQLLIYSVWLWWGYMFVGVCMLMVVLASAAMAIYITRQNQLIIQQMTSYSTIVTTKRDNEWVELTSMELVPGDLVQVRGDWVLPCDVVLVRGTAVADESGLTGESRPIRKSELPLEDSRYDEHSHSKHTLFAGTRTLQAGKGEEKVLGRVLSTGTNTNKGQLVTHILFPQEMVFKYDEELAVALLLLLVYGLIAFVLVYVCLTLNGSSIKWNEIWLYGIFTVSQVLSPLVPIALVVGQNMASKRLGQMGVFCVNPKRIAISGKIRCFCFDKTGTLTKDGLDFIGLHEKDQHTGQLRPKLTETPSEKSIMLHGLATCHSLTQMGSQLVGNEVEVNMFQATKWELLEKDNQTPAVRSPDKSVTLTILKRFEFDHKRMTMSSVVRDENGQVFIFAKGSSEAIGARCVADSLPDSYDTVSKQHAMEGCYVISLSTKALGQLSDEAVAQIDRDQAESELTWLGLILFRNELKPDTADAILALKEGNVRCVMITGDNAQCGCYIARASGMIANNTQLMLADLNKTTGLVEWREMAAGSSELPEDAVSTADIVSQGDRGKRELAVTGAAFNVLVESGEMDTLITKIRIFARMSPEGKVLTVKLLSEKGLVIGMCGDGGNDCGALRQAHVGIALSEAEASVVSPFTSKSKSIMSVVDLLREGRGALATSFAGYKFLITYGQLFSVVKLTCLGLGVIMCQMDYIFIDAVVVMALSYTMTLSRPQDKLQPQRPTSSLLGPVTVGSIVGLQVIHMFFLGMAFAVIHNNPDFVPWPAEFSAGGSYWFLSDNWECTVLFTMFAGQFLSSAVSYSFGNEYRSAIWRNRSLCLVWASTFLLISLAILLPDCGLTRLFHMSSHQDNRPHADNPVWRTYQAAGNKTSPPMRFGTRFSIWMLMVLGSFFSAVWEKSVVNGKVAHYFRRTRPSQRPELKY